MTVQDLVRTGLEIRVRGTVQGVGFRPTVWRLAQEEGLVGQVSNDSAGVLIEAVGEAGALQRFLGRLEAEAPPLAHIETIETRPLERILEHAAFTIAGSGGGSSRTRITADARTCAACEAEVADPTERRYRYPFANCTHCGPRLSIVRQVPYDRRHTTMAAFPMCADCRREYEDPADRRFHAQPIACAACGPRVWRETLPTADPPEARGTPWAELQAVVSNLREGRIVAVRGLGGFHLACDGTDPQAVARLRERKHRWGKPLALMAADVATIRRYCQVSALEEAVLQSPEAPIVVLGLSGLEDLPEALAPGLDALGFMLPTTPLHRLLVEEVGRPLVMTSGNLSSEPQAITNEDARERLSGIADTALLHDRDIANRVDDSVVRVMDGHPRFLRRARGYAPRPLPLPAGFEEAPSLLAVGAEQKATFCLLHEGAAVISQHQGDLDELATFEDYLHNLELYTAILEHRPEALVTDLHPAYQATRLAQERAAEAGLPLHRVQHHHAHVAACLADNGVSRQAAPVLGIALDGTGFGTDGTVWGGEFLLASYGRSRRLASLRPVAMPGGAAAVREPWRNLYAHLRTTLDWGEVQARYGHLQALAFLATRPLSMVDAMIEGRLNSPLASSTGRLFDAVAAALGFCTERVSYQAQGAMELEAAAARAPRPAEAELYRLALGVDDAGLLRLDPAPMWQALLADLDRGLPRETVALRFHLGLSASLADAVSHLRVRADGVCFDTVALTGGCLQNRILFEDLSLRLTAMGLHCLSHRHTPANDGSLSLGQALVAAARVIDLRTSPSTNPPSKDLPCA